MLQDDDFDDVDGLVDSCGMSFQIDAWERIKKSYKELAQQTDNSASPKLPRVEEMLTQYFCSEPGWGDPRDSRLLSHFYEFIVGIIGQ